MTDFKPTPSQQAVIDAAQLRFEKSRDATKGYSKRFLDKCNDQNPQTPGSGNGAATTRVDCPAENANPAPKDGASER